MNAYVPCVTYVRRTWENVCIYLVMSFDDFLHLLTTVYTTVILKVGTRYTYMITPPPLCVFFHIKPSFLLVDIQHTQCPRWFFVVERCDLCGHQSLIQAATLYQVDSSSSTMPCRCAGLWQAQHTYASYPDTLTERTRPRAETHGLCADAHGSTMK